MTTAGVNRVVLLGAIGKYGVEMRFTPNGAAHASLTLAIPEKGQDGKTYSTLVPCEIWGKRAEAATELQPDTLVVFEGKRKRQKKGEAGEMVVSGFDVTPVGEGAPATRPASPQAGSDDDIPF